MYLFFFFQAEDGIRDSSVTGVQTCALPISSAAAPPASGFAPAIASAPMAAAAVAPAPATAVCRKLRRVTPGVRSLLLKVAPCQSRQHHELEGEVRDM